MFPEVSRPEETLKLSHFWKFGNPRPVFRKPASRVRALDNQLKQICSLFWRFFGSKVFGNWETGENFQGLTKIRPICLDINSTFWPSMFVRHFDDEQYGNCDDIHIRKSARRNMRWHRCWCSLSDSQVCALLLPPL